MFSYSFFFSRRDILIGKTDVTSFNGLLESALMHFPIENECEFVLKIMIAIKSYFLSHNRSAVFEFEVLPTCVP